MPGQPIQEELLKKIRNLEEESAALRKEIQRLRQTETRYESIFNSARDAFLILDLKGRLVHANPEASRMYGYSLEELTRLSGRDIVHPDFHHIFAQFKKNVRTRAHFEAESIHIRKDGTLFPVEVKGTQFDYQGKKHLMAMVRDISKRKEAEEAFKKTETSLNLTLNAISEGLWDWDVETGEVYRSPGWFSMLGYEPDELPGNVDTWKNTIHPNDFSRVMTVFQAHLDQQSPAYECEYRCRMKNGKWKWILDMGKVVERDADGKPLRMVGAHSDIHNRKLAEKALRKAHKDLEKRIKVRTADLAETNMHMAALINAIPDIVYFKDLEGRNLIVNQGFEDLIGLKREAIIGKTDEEILPRELADYCRASDMETIRSGGPLRLEESTPGPDGTVKHFDTIKAPIYDDHGHCQGLVGISRDITARKQAEEALKESEDRFRKFADEATFEGIIFHENRKILDVNRRFEMMLGYDRNELVGMDSLNTLSPESRELAQKSVRENPEKPYEALALRKDGTTFPVEIHGRLIPFHGKAIRVAAIRDLSEQKRAEEGRQRLEAAFHESQKMEAVGTLAGGIAHDFNNLLMGIQGNASLILLDLDPSHPHFQRLQNIEESVRRGSDLTRQLLGFARGGKYEVRPADLNKVIQSSSRMFGRTKKEITLHEKYQQDIWIVEADQGQIEQALLNLYVNAWQAMPGSGELYLETENIILGEKDVKPYEATPGRYVKISITDTGTGMDAATLRRAFEPFFSTKGIGRGTGLGLAAVYGIVKNHGGFVTVHSQKSQGTTFYLYLPASEKTTAEKKPPRKALQKGNETILLVDDEGIIVDIGQQMLEALGYNVILARSGGEALDIYRKKRDIIDIIILDMIMPGVGGGEAYDLLREMNPNVKVLLSSGYSIDGEAAEILNRGCNGFIQKPFNLDDLSRKIREVLGADQPK